MSIFFSITDNYEDLSAWYSISDIEETSKFISNKRQQMYLQGRAAMRRLLFSETCKKNWEIRLSENGKPYIPNGPHISLSHSGDMIACALCMDVPIGIDIEQWKQRDFNNIAGFSFTASQQQDVQKNGIEAFYKYWTIKEAIAKINGSSVFQCNVQTDDYTIYSQNIENRYSLTIAAEVMTGTTIKTIQINY